jgi:hypothetical protein
MWEEAGTTTSFSSPDAATRTRPGRPSVGRGPAAFRPPEPPPVEPPPSPQPADAGSILETHRSAPPVRITHENVITGEPAELLWEAYHANFEPLESLAVLQHLYSRDEMLAEFANPRIRKIVGWQDGVPVGLAMVTNSLEEVPQISPRFLRERYPEHARRNAIYFGILVMVTPGHRGMTLFNRLYIELWQIPARAGGVLVFDICDFNRQTFDTDRLTQRIAENFPHSNVGVLDRQTWYVAELPEPIPESPGR